MDLVLQRNVRARGIAAAVAVVAVVTVASIAVAEHSGLGTPSSQHCTALGGTSALQVSIPKDVSPRLEEIELELRQGGHASTVRFPSRPEETQGSHGFVQPGVLVKEGTDRTYAVMLDQFEPGWEAQTPAELRVTGFDASGRRAIQTTDSFRFEKWYPNGEDCAGPPALSHATALSTSDLVAHRVAQR